MNLQKTNREIPDLMSEKEFYRLLTTAPDRKTIWQAVYADRMIAYSQGQQDQLKIALAEIEKLQRKDK